jgi:hypothetical protein
VAFLPLPDVTFIILLPSGSISGDLKQEFFSKGITENISWVAGFLLGDKVPLVGTLVKRCEGGI